MTTPEGVNLYEVLGVAPDADEHQLDQAFRVLARRHHPDTRTQHDEAGPADPDSQRFQEILAAYAVLRDPVARAAYDRTTNKPATIDTTHHSGSPTPTAIRLAPQPSFEPPLRAGPVRWTSTPRHPRSATDRPT